MKNKLAFVLGGGGARGAYQVGALWALFEAGYKPDLLIGSSIGAVNAAFVAIQGANLETIPLLVKAWHDSTEADLLPSNYLWLTVRALFNRSETHTFHHLREFLIEHGLPPDLRFGDIQGVQLAFVATDLNSGLPVVFGGEDEHRVLDGLLASTALPPWVRPMSKEGMYLIDGGFSSNLPVEPAMALGATQIIALDLFDPRLEALEPQGFGPFFAKVVRAVEQRQLDLELALARARRIPVLHIALRSEEMIALWDFHHCEVLIEHGYRITRERLERWKFSRLPGWVEAIRERISGEKAYGR